MLHVTDFAASPHSSMTAENVLRDGKGNVISCARKFWREEEKGVGNLSHLAAAVPGLGCACFCGACGSALPELRRCTGGKG